MSVLVELAGLEIPGRYVYLSIYLTDKELPSGSYTLTLETVRR